MISRDDKRFAKLPGPEYFDVRGHPLVVHEYLASPEQPKAACESDMVLTLENIQEFWAILGRQTEVDARLDRMICDSIKSDAVSRIFAENIDWFNIGPRFCGDPAN